MQDIKQEQTNYNLKENKAQSSVNLITQHLRKLREEIKTKTNTIGSCQDNIRFYQQSN